MMRIAHLLAATRYMEFFTLERDGGCQNLARLLVFSAMQISVSMGHASDRQMDPMTPDST